MTTHVRRGNTNQQGIAHLLPIIAVVVLFVVAAIGYQVVQRNSSSKASLGKSQNQASQTDKISGASRGSQSMMQGESGSQQSPAQAQSANQASTSQPVQPKTSTSSVAPGSVSSSPTSSGSPTSSSTGTQTSPTSPGTDSDTPQVNLTYPAYWGQTVSGKITVTATATDAGGISRVVFRIAKIGSATPVYSETDTTAPYSAAFDTTTLPNGGSNYTVEAQAFDNSGKGNMASYRINIQN